MKDPFDTLGVAPRFALDVSAAELRHRELSKALHPDRFAGASPTERRIALSRAIDVNEAWRTLKDPVKRAEALLRRRGVEVGETAEPKPSNELLLEMMEAREELAEARRAKDLTRARKLGEAMHERRGEVTARLAHALDGCGEGTEDARKALVPLGELRYVRRFLDEVLAIEEELAS